MSDKPDEEIVENDFLLDDWWEKKIEEYSQKKVDSDKRQKQYKRDLFRRDRKQGSGSQTPGKNFAYSFDFERN